MSVLSLFEEKIKSAKNILIVAHVNPDGDALGATIATKCAIEERYGKKTDALFIGKYPDIYEFLPLKEQLIDADGFDVTKIYDVAIALDVASKERMMQIEKVYDNAKFKVNIDHHKTNNKYGDFAVVNGDASSTGEVLYGIFEDLKIDITKNIAIALYTSILTDTGCFKYNSTTAKSMDICSKLLSKGVDPTYIAGQIYANKPKAMVLLNSWAVSNAKFLQNGKIAYSVVTLKDLEQFGADQDHTEGIVETLKEINTVEIAMLFKELKNGFTKVSFRSKNYDVASICKKFDGGGHTNAAGCTVKKPMNIAIEKISEELEDI